jgi:multiple sugar transport system ATP-binding protein
VGLRPEDLRPAPQSAGAGTEASIEATIENIEPVGNEIILSLNSRAGNVVCRLPPQALPELGRPLRLHYSGDRLRYFNAQSGARLR